MTTEMHFEREKAGAVGKRIWLSRALVNPTKRWTRIWSQLVMTSFQVPCEDVEMRRDEEKEAEVPRARLDHPNPTSREKQKHGDSGQKDKFELLDEENRLFSLLLSILHKHMQTSSHV